MGLLHSMSLAIACMLQAILVCSVLPCQHRCLEGTVSMGYCLRRLLVDCNQLAVEIDAEIAVIHNWVRDQYRPKFPELESLVHHPIDYARVVKAIGNEVRRGSWRHHLLLDDAV